MRRNVLAVFLIMLPVSVRAQEDYLVFDDGQTHTFSETTNQGLLIRNGSHLTFSGNMLPFFAESALVLEDSATVAIEGGEVIHSNPAAAIAGTGTSKATMSAGLISVAEPDFAVGVELSEKASFELSGGRIDVSGDRTDEAGIRLRDQAEFRMTGGVINLPFKAVKGVSLEDDTRAVISAGVFELHRFDTPSVEPAFIAAADRSFVAVAGGEYHWTTDARGAPVPAPGRGVTADDAAHVEIEGGRFVIDIEASELIDVAGVVARGESHVLVRGGDFQLAGRSDSSENEVAVSGISAHDNSRIEMLGGGFTLLAESENVTMRHLDVRDQSQVILHGSGFNFPMFENLEATAGTIEGTLSDGSSIAFDFTRDPSAVIRLVPEPCTITLLLIATVCMWFRRRNDLTGLASVSNCRRKTV